jgi:DNA polymerase-1
MRIVLDIEADGLENPTKVWLVVAKDLDSGELHVFRRPSDDQEETKKLAAFCAKATSVVGHNLLEYDIPVVDRLLGIKFGDVVFIDTLIVSRLVDFSRSVGHSLESYGIEFGLLKGDFKDFTKYSLEMEEYCVRDVEITCRVYDHYRRIIDDPAWDRSIRLEHDFQHIVNRLHDNGFHFDRVRADKLLERVRKELDKLDQDILSSFPPKLKPIREIHPKVTKHGTLSKSDFRFVRSGDLSDFNGGPFTRCEWVDFNPSSVKQVVEVLNVAGWKPVDKTKTHIETERELQIAQRGKKPMTVQELKDIQLKLDKLRVYGWKINENNLVTLPPSAPTSARLLARRILLESRRRTLTEWLALVAPDGRIHGKFVGLGAWTHRMAHQNPNTANIPGEFQLDGNKKLYGKEMRQLWTVPKDRLLVGVDAEGIQLRIFAHYIDDPEFTRALVEGKKDDKTDPHSLNQRIMGRLCKSRAAAKRFIYALLLGAGIGKLAEILDCSVEQAREALDRILQRYTGFARLKSEVLPQDGKRGWFTGLDGRRVSIPGETAGTRTHLAMSGYLQNGEAVVMKKACLLWHKQLEEECGKTVERCTRSGIVIPGLRDNGINNPSAQIEEEYGRPQQTGSFNLGGNNLCSRFASSSIHIVNFVHDEWQTEVPNDLTLAIKVAKIQADSLRIVGEELGLKCPLAGSYWNDDHKDYTIGVNWYQTH